MEPFTLTAITDDIFKITEPYFVEHANMYLIRGNDYDLLIDSGVGLCDVKVFLQKQGFRPRVLLTHAHFDHAGGLKYFDKDEILITQHTLENLKNRDLLGLTYLRPEDFDTAAVNNLVGTTPDAFCQSFAIQVSPTFVTLLGNSITVGSYTFERIETPGHTDDSFVLLDATHKVLITADTLYDGKLVTGLPNSNNDDFQLSLARIASLDFDLVLPGHNNVLNHSDALSTIKNWRSLLCNV